MTSEMSDIKQSLKAAYARRDLHFSFEARTSRGSMTDKETYLLRLVAPDDDPSDPRAPGAVGECAIFRGLSADDSPLYEQRLKALCRAINRGEPFDISEWSSLRFGLECALISVDRGFSQVLFPTAFTQGKQQLPINGLVWMDSVENMSRQVREKIARGFTTVKFKIGAHDFESEMKMLDQLRMTYGPDQITIRLDANGAFSPDDALEKLKRLSALDIHSIEQPIKAGQWDRMAYLCENSPLPIALDEELIGVTSRDMKRKMLYYIAPQYIVLKPSLCGGLSGASEWAETADQFKIGWWPTSALESSVGLDAIAQWTAATQPGVCSGLGTGQLYTNNFESPLSVDNGHLSRDPNKRIELDGLQWIVPE